MYLADPGVCVQYMHIASRDQCNWLRERIELPSAYQYSTDEKKLMLDRLAWSDMFETFLANKYAAAKRFGLEGAESLIPGMKVRSSYRYVAFASTRRRKVAQHHLSEQRAWQRASCGGCCVLCRCCASHKDAVVGGEPNS